MQSIVLRKPQGHSINRAHMRLINEATYDTKRPVNVDAQKVLVCAQAKSTMAHGNGKFITISNNITTLSDLCSWFSVPTVRENKCFLNKTTVEHCFTRVEVMKNLDHAKEYILHHFPYLNRILEDLGSHIYAETLKSFCLRLKCLWIWRSSWRYYVDFH